MATLIAWCGFIGAWLLVVAAVYQAALELRSEELERDEIDQAKRAAKPDDRLWSSLASPARPTRRCACATPTRCSRSTASTSEAR